VTASGGQWPRSAVGPRPDGHRVVNAGHGIETEHHRLPNADAAWLHMDRPTNLMIINAVMLLDGRLEEERLRNLIRKRLVEPYPRFRERVVESRLPLRGPSFEDDPHWNIDRHMHASGCLSPATRQRYRSCWAT
jgi:hypothetical protein